MIRSSQSAANHQDKVVIGKIGAPHGIKGELRVTPLTDFTERFAELEQVHAGNDLLTIESVKYHKQFVILKFKEYPVREQAASLTGRFLYVDKEDAVPLEEGEYYTFDIIGLEVFDTEGNSLGHVTDVLRTGSNDVYVTSKKGEAKQLLIPALKTVVQEINVPECKMVVDMPEEA